MTTNRQKLSALPWICPDHPDAKILHSWDHTQSVLNGYPAGNGWKTGGDKYECAVCGRELAADKPMERSQPL